MGYIFHAAVLKQVPSCEFFPRGDEGEDNFAGVYLERTGRSWQLRAVINVRIKYRI